MIHIKSSRSDWQSDLLFGYQSHLRFVEKIIPRPIDQNHQSVAEPNQPINVKRDPDHPCNESAERQAPDARHRRVASDRSKQPRVFIMERFGLFTFQNFL